MINTINPPDNRRREMNRLEPEIHPLLTRQIIDALHLKRLHTALDFVKADTHQIIKTARLNFREVLAVKHFLLKKYSAAPINGFDHYKTTLNNTAIVPTGIKSVDHLLDGGLFTGNIYEICGLPASGKTQFILSLTKNVVLTTQLQVHIFDTKNDISGTRIKKMLSGFDQNLSQVIMDRTHTKHDLINGLYDIKNNLENGLKLRLIIIDSLPCVILGSNDYAANNIYLNHLTNIIRYIAMEHHIAFLITNLITTWNEPDFKMRQDTKENIACGKYWSKIPNTRMKVEKSARETVYRVSILNSNSQGKVDTTAEIHLTDKGFL